MTVDNGYDLAKVFNCCVILAAKYKMLVGRIGQVGAGEVAFTAFHNGNQATALAWILGLRMGQNLSF